MSRWCHPTISSSVVPFFSCPQSFPASGSFQMSQLFTSGGQNIGVSASASVLPMNIQDWTTACQASPSITNSQSPPKHMSIELVIPIQLSHPPSSPSPPIPNPSQHQGLFQWVNSSHEVAKVLELKLQHQSFQWTPPQDWFPLGWTGLISLQSKELSRVFSNTTVQKHQLFGAQLSL